MGATACVHALWLQHAHSTFVYARALVTGGEVVGLVAFQ